MYKIKAFKDAVRSKNWTQLKKLLLSSSPGEAMFLLSFMLREIEESEYRQVKSRHLAYWLGKHPEVVALWVSYTQGEGFRFFSNLLVGLTSGSPTAKLHRSVFLRHITSQKPAIKEWLRYELLEFKATPIRSLTDEF